MVFMLEVVGGASSRVRGCWGGHMGVHKGVGRQGSGWCECWQVTCFRGREWGEWGSGRECGQILGGGKWE